MYYYIIEPSHGKTINRQEKIKDILGNLGIAGETVTPSAARTIEELTHLGVVKGYSTIVAVGSETLVNKIITVLANDKNGKNTVLGIIPNDFNSNLAKMIGVTDLQSACNGLKFRKLETVRLGLIEPNKYFITEARISNYKNTEIYFSVDNFQGRALVKNVSIKPGLEVSFYDANAEGGSSKKLVNWLFGKKIKDIYSSFFTTKRVRIEAEKGNLQVKVSGETVAKTPVTFQNRDKTLKIIVARDRIKQEEKNKATK